MTVKSMTKKPFVLQFISNISFLSIIFSITLITIFLWGCDKDIQEKSEEKDSVIVQTKLSLKLKNCDLKLLHPFPTPVDLNDVHMFDDNRFIIVGEFGLILNTYNGGENFNISYLGENLALKSIHFLNDSLGWIAGHQGIFKTTDSGLSWQIISNFNVSYPEIYFESQELGWIVDDLSHKIFYTDDGGNNWRQVNNGKLNRFLFVRYNNKDNAQITDEKGNVLFVVPDYGTRSWWEAVNKRFTMFTKIHSVSADTIWCVWKNFFYSFDGGMTWSTQQTETYQEYESIFFLNSRSAISVGGSGLIAKTNNAGKDWQLLSKGLTYHLNSVYFLDSLRGWVAGEFGLVLSTSNGGRNWQNENLEVETNFDQVYFVDSLNGWLIGSKIYRTTNTGVNWFEMENIDYDLQVESIKFLDSKHGWMIGKRTWKEYRGYILKTTDGGLSWKTVNDFRIFGNKKLSLSILDSMNVWISTGLRTSDGGQSWIDLDYKSNDDYDFKLIDFTNEKIGYALHDFVSRVYKTTDGGISWIELSIPYLSEIVYMKFFNDHIGVICGSLGDVLYTDDGGGNWNKLQIYGLENFPFIENRYINNIYFPDIFRGYMTGNWGTIIRFDLR